jgi:hypothetical protein
MTSVAHVYNICSVCLTSPGAAYFSTKKNRNVKEPLVSSHTIPVWETASTPFVGIVTLLVYDDECCICLQHLQRLSPQEWLLPIVVLGFDISARTNRFLRLFGLLGQLKNNLKRRGYKQSIIKKSFNKANNISRSSLLQYKEKQKCKRTPCVHWYTMTSVAYVYSICSVCLHKSDSCL